ncbi:MAG: tetratricopeptide repeat protein [Anaerolineaceae bacterium]|nr:tetratricopeptide repeat protein [Anaerolineaceae bacterium]
MLEAEYNVDRLKPFEEQLKAAQTPIERIDALNALAHHNSEGDPEKAVEWAGEAFELATDIHYQQGIIDALLNMAWCSYCRSDYPTSIECVTRVLPLARSGKYPKQEADAINILGNNHERLGNWHEALDYYLEALSLSEQQGNTAHVAVMRSNIGDIYASMGNFEKAIEHYQDSYQLDKAIDHVGASDGLTLTYMAEAYLQLNDTARSLDFAQQGLALMRPERYWVGISRALTVIGQAHEKLNDLPQSIAYYEEALTAAQQGEAKREAATALMRLAETLTIQGRTAVALSYLWDALAIFERLETQPLIAEAHGLLAGVYKSLGDFEQALEHYEKQQTVKETLFSHQADMRLKTLQTQYEVERVRLEAEAQSSRNRVLEEQINLHEQMIADLESYADNIAHDLKNPIAVISTYMELLEMDLEGQIPEENFRAIKNVTTTAEKMNTIIDSLLTLARARKQAIMPQPIDMGDILRNSIERLALPIQQKNAHIHVSHPLPDALGHSSWLEEVWVNYIGNAIKYGGSPPEVHIGAVPLTGGLIRYWISDNGKGLSTDEQAHLFQKFERLGQNKIDGHGLGLTIIKTVVERLGGSVGVASSGIPGEGSTFSFTLPAAPSD